MRNHKPMISVIMPCYNAEQYIADAVRSFAENTISRKCELIIVNDGSQDRSMEEVKAVAEEYPEHRIICIDIPNSGVSEARNRGIEEARGKYVSFLDADDMYGMYFLEALYSGIRNDRADICFCYWTSDPEKVTKKKVKAAPIDRKKAMDLFLYRKKPIAVWSILYKRSILIGHQIRFPEKIKYGEDIEFIWKNLLACRSCSIVKGVYYYYRTTPESATHKVTWDKTEILDVVENIIEQMKVSDPDYLPEFESYMVSRKVIALQKEFALCGSEDYFRQMQERSDRKKVLAVASKGKPSVRLAALTYYLSPRLFYHFLSRASGTHRD